MGIHNRIGFMSLNLKTSFYSEIPQRLFRNSEKPSSIYMQNYCQGGDLDYQTVVAVGEGKSADSENVHLSASSTVRFHSRS